MRWTTEEVCTKLRNEKYKQLKKEKRKNETKHLCML